MIQPFKWPFIIIPNLPLDLLNMIESPVPFLIGILSNSNNNMFNNKKTLFNNYQSVANVVIYNHTTNSLDLIIRESITCEEPELNNLKGIIKDNIKMAKYYLTSKNIESYDNYCKRTYNNIFEHLKREIGDYIENSFFSSQNVIFI